MKSTIKFSKGFIPSAIFSIAVIAFGVVGFFVKGINFGIDFKPGLVEEVRVAPPVAEIVYEGALKVSLDLSSTKVDVIVNGVGSENQTYTYNFSKYSNVQSLADEMNKINGVKVTVKNGSFDSTKLFLNSAVSNVLSATPLLIYPAGTSTITTDNIRNALSGLQGVSVKQLGIGEDASYQIRIGINENQKQSDVIDVINNELYKTFNKDEVAIIKTDFIGSSSSKSNTIKTIIIFFITVLLIWGYAAFRFHWDFALGSVVALIHDTLIMLTVIVWTQLEFDTTVFAAVLTIVGYSINATVVILDRVRFNLQYQENVNKFSDILNKALSDTLTRSIITTVTTLFAVVALFIFTTGSIKNFAFAMIIGLICGMYSSIFISSGFIAACRKNWKPEFGIHHSLKNVTEDNN